MIQSAQWGVGALRGVALAAAVGGIFFCSPVSADWTTIPSRDFHLAEPPAPGGRAYTHDFEVLHESERTRSAADCALAEAQKIPTFEAFYGPSARLLSRQEFEAARPLMGRVFKLGERVTGFFKSKFLRPRPYSVDRTLEPCAYRPEGARSYPSSHATLAALGGCVLSRAYPERAGKIEAYGQFLGNLRFIVGVHHPSDVLAGQDLAAQICRQLFSEPSFLRDFEASRNR